MTHTVLEARNLKRHFISHHGLINRTTQCVQAVDDVSLELKAGETLALVGESGCGKSTLARCLTLLDKPTAGEILINGEKPKNDLKQYCRNVQMIFQDPYASLNPRLPVGVIIAEPLVIHKIGSKQERRNKVLELLDVVGLRRSDINRYPHQFSGGQRQRISIARALALNPAVIIADEPVSALDVSIQSQILNLFKELQEEFNLAYLFISHDMAVVHYFADRVAVMYLGSIVEEGVTEKTLINPLHPYTRALIDAAPLISKVKRKHGDALKGDPPSPLDPPSGCRFHPRCSYAIEACRSQRPKLEGSGGHKVACSLSDSLHLTPRRRLEGGWA